MTGVQTCALPISPSPTGSGYVCTVVSAATQAGFFLGRVPLAQRATGDTEKRPEVEDTSSTVKVQYRVAKFLKQSCRPGPAERLLGVISGLRVRSTHLGPLEARPQAEGELTGSHGQGEASPGGTAPANCEEGTAELLFSEGSGQIGRAHV